MKRILTLQDFSSMGRCSLTAAIPIISACGNEAVGLPTCLLSTQTYGIEGYTFTDLEHNMLPSFRHWQKLGIKFDCLYTGFLGSIPSLNAAIEIAKTLKNQGAIIAVDPAMAEDGKLYSIFGQDYFERMKELIGLCDIFLPNFTEGKMLADIKSPLLPNKENAVMLLKILENKGLKKVVLSGIIDGSEMGTATLENGVISFQFNGYYSKQIHGAGDILSSVIVSMVMKGLSLLEAAQRAVDFVHDCIDATIYENADLRFGLNFEKVLCKLTEKAN
ncbi:MAG: hypothetical protein GX891_05045 [Clostridiales bacterium]|nr:hypothetical protein [Clostridiales bacterium]